MSRWLPHPLVGLALLGVWLVLTQSLSVGQILLGTLVALLATQALAALQSTRQQPVKIRPMFKLAGIVLYDILRSNLAVAAVILFKRSERVSGFINVPLELTNRNGLAVLALIITTTPGTLWVELDSKRSTLLVHVLDLVDEEEWIHLIKHRYEALLLEIFGR